MRIAVNTCRDLRRSAWFRHTDRRTPAELFPAAAVRGEEQDRTLSSVVMAMPEKFKQVLLLYYYQGMTLQETGEALGLSVSAVGRRLKKAEALLKEEWTGGGEA